MRVVCQFPTRLSSVLSENAVNVINIRLDQFDRYWLLQNTTSLLFMSMKDRPKPSDYSIRFHLIQSAVKILGRWPIVILYVRLTHQILLKLLEVIKINQIQNLMESRFPNVWPLPYSIQHVQHNLTKYVRMTLLCTDTHIPLARSSHTVPAPFSLPSIALSNPRITQKISRFK